MDITRGSFDDFSSRPSTGSSIRLATPSSLEVLIPEKVEPQSFFIDEEICSEEYYSASESNTESNNETDSPHSSIVKDDIELKMEKAIKKMKKLDILLEKATVKEKEVKHRRAEFNKNLHEELRNFKTGLKNVSETHQNVKKFLALMPPAFDEQNNNFTDEFHPIFPTQAEDDNLKTFSSSPTLSQERSSSSQTKTESPKPNKQSKSMKNVKKKIDFIKRNVELAKDAGSYIAMTDEEKLRLKELTKNLDSIEDVSGDDLPTVEYTGEGFEVEVASRARLTYIDERIQEIGSRMSLQSFDHESYNYKLPICDTSSDSVQDEDVSAMTSNIIDGGLKRLQDIEEKLDKLDQNWKSMFAFTTPHMDRSDLDSLLSDCTEEMSSVSPARSVPISSITENTEEEEDTDDWPKPAWDTESSACSVMSTLSYIKPLERETLDQLLAEARKCLGITIIQSEEELSDTDTLS